MIWESKFSLGKERLVYQGINQKPGPWLLFSRHILVMRRVCVQTTGISKPPITTSALSGTPSLQLMRGSGNSMLEFVLCVSLSVCGFFHLCLCLAFFFYLFVCVDGLIWRLVVTSHPSVWSGCQETWCLQHSVSAPLASSQAWGGGWSFC